LAPAAAAIRADHQSLDGHGGGVAGREGAGTHRRQPRPRRPCVLHSPATKITAAVVSSGDADLGSLTKMLVNTALDDG
jgi:hypothetical protein